MPNLAPPITTVEAARRLSRADRRRGGRRLHAADDLLSDRRRRPRRDRARVRGRRVDRRQALSGGRDDQQRQRRHRHPHHLSGARADGADRHGAVRPRRGDRPGRRRVRPRGGVHRARAVARWSRDFPALKIVFEHITTAEAVAVRREHRAECRGDDHSAAPASSTATRCSPAGSGPTLIACRSPSARSTGLRCAKRRLRARPNSSSAPTARRTRARPRKCACGCAGIFNAPFALESYATVFEEEGALDSFEAFASSERAAFLRAAAQRGDGDAGARRSRRSRTKSTAWCRSTPAQTLRWRMVAG